MAHETTLDRHLKRLISSARSVTSSGKGRSSARINCHEVVCQVTPKASNGDFYVLFYRDGKRTSRERLPQELGFHVTT
jgi:hypothetical protein